MINKIIIFIPFMFLCISGLKAQNIEGWIETNEKLPVEKIYLHTDREYFFTGETIWLKAYLTDSRSGRLIPGAENIYIQLIDEKGNTAISLNLMGINGQAPGHISLPDTLNPGNYLLQAFTDYLLNFGADAFFHKTVTISKTALSLGAVEARQRSSPPRRMVADVSFLPEGGKLLEGISNLVAFKAIDQNGYGIDAGGFVRDNSGNEVQSFSTDYKGMGIFFFTPEPGKSYHATITGFPSFRFSFDSLTVSEGVKIQLVNQTSRELMVNITGNTEKFEGETFHLVNMHRGETVFYHAFKMEGQNQLLKFDTKMLKGGLNQLILLDKNLVPVSERLLFSENFNLNKLKVKFPNNNFAIRSEVNFQISGEEDLSEVSNLSLAVVHENAIPQNGTSNHILSELLVNSELKGFVETPSDFFIDSEIDARTKQRLLTLTNGWSSYFWNSAPASGDTLHYKQTAGLSLQGTANDQTTGNPLSRGEITLVIEKDREMAFLTQNTDSEGGFTFSGLLFNDTANVYVQAKNERGRQNTVISLQPVVQIQTQLKSVQALKRPGEIRPELEIQQYQAYRKINESRRKQGAGISRTNLRQENIQLKDGHFKIYDQADQVIEVPEIEASFGNILEFLTGKVAGLDISGDQVTIRGTSNFDNNSTPLFLIDGLPVTTGNFSGIPEEVGRNVEISSAELRNSSVDKIKSIPLGDIEKVEILKSPQNLALFGTEGANGVIAIYTRKGKTNVPAAAKGVIEQKIAGYSSFRKFYSPKYLPENNNPDKPDFRITLFWEPEIVLQNDPAELSFFTSDQIGKYKVIVEGISESGRICIGSAEFEVTGETEN
jgi:hypothetical protein